MDYNMDFLIAALIFLLLILYHFLRQRKAGQANSRAFLFFMAVGIADILFDLISTILILWGGPHLRSATELSLLLLYLMQVLLPFTLFLYTQSLRRPACREDGMGCPGRPDGADGSGQPLERAAFSDGRAGNLLPRAALPRHISARVVLCSAVRPEQHSEVP